uniref:Zinc finger PHD-type domain-containing protein n=1 Tax=Heliothis virescens TaxID=7102 RepID=A0A2A4JD92_HELVI
MVKCGGCGKFLSPIEAARCDICRSTYHRECVGVNPVGLLTTPWHCPECKKNQLRDNRAETPVRGHAAGPLEDSLVNLMDTSPINNTALDATQEMTMNITTELKTFKEEFIRTIKYEFQLMRDDLAELRSSLQAANDRVSTLEERVSLLENRKQEHASSEVNEIIAELRSEINDRDQELLANDVQISNLPETQGENPVHTALLIASKLGVKVKTRDIVSAERVGGRRINATQPAPVETRPRFLVVRLARRDLRDEMLEAARVRRGMTSADLDLPGPAARIYINERLTKTNRELFRRAREAGARLGWQFVWSRRGRILARYKPGDSVCQIRCEADLLRVFAPIHATTVHVAPMP